MDAPLEHVDVLIVGAGLSGIGAAHHLQEKCPTHSYAIFEARDAIGGTWDLFRYPGIRSDSDMYTLGYSFRPWESSKAIADGDDIREYVRATAREGGIDRQIRFGHRVTSAEFSTEESRWTVSAAVGDNDVVRITCSFLFMCSGYYRYDEGYTPHFEGTERFPGPIIHPQHWPEDLDYTGKRIVVIGSGATAVTLVPSLAKTGAEHVTMLQRSPSYIVSLPSEDPLANALRRRLPLKTAYAITRWKNVLTTMASFQISRRYPAVARKAIRRLTERQLPEGCDVDVHFKPTYNPWEQRLCLVPDSDLFRALRKGTAEIVTDRIATFTETGLELESGQELAADIVVTATGLNILALGGMAITVDGTEVALSETMGYKGMMLSDVPNLAFAFGYTNASWTLKCDLTCEYVCRLLNHMRSEGYARCVPVQNDPTVAPQPFVDFNSGYVLRAIEHFPKQGSKAPWRLYQNYVRDMMALRRGELDDGALRFERTAARRPDAVLS